jgi:hypothetical protein
MRRAAALLLLLAACKKPAGEAACPHDPGFDRSGVIQVRAEHRPAVLRRDLGLAEIAREAAGSAGAGRAQGLTVVDNQLAFRTLVNMETSRGRTCVWFDEVRVDLTPASVSIYVPREYAEDSCEYLAVLEHEREHESVHRERLEAAAVEIERALKDARWLPARGNPLETEDRASAEAALNAKIRKVVTPVYERYKSDLGRAQAELDRPDLYQWVARRCAGWK